MIIKNGRIVTDHVELGDLRIVEETIKEIGGNLDPEDGEEVVDASGCFVFPGFIDPHTHLGMINALAETSDNYETGSKAGLYGGTTTVINFCTGGKNLSLTESLDEELRRAASACCDYTFHMEMVDGTPEKLEEMEKIKDRGITSFKIYLAYGFRLDDREIYDLLKEAKRLGVLVEAHCETGALLDGIMESLVEEKKNTAHYQHIAHPPEAEAESINRLAYMAKNLDVPFHIVHLSTEWGLEELRRARTLGVSVTAETCPQYLVLDDSVYEKEGNEAMKYVFSPPARSPEDREAIRQGVAKGEIQTMATDHCSFSFSSKEEAPAGDLRKIPGGIPGIEHRGLITYTELLATGKIDEPAFVRLMSENAAKLYGLYPKKGVLAPGSDGDVVIYDPSATTEISAKTQHQHTDFTPFEGYTAKGKVRDVFLRGHHVIENGEWKETVKGKFLPRKG